MSKTYRCRVQRDVRVVSRVADEVKYKVNLLDILDPEEMEAEYRQALRAMGAREEEGGGMVLDLDGVRVCVDPGEKTATAGVNEEEEISISVNRDVRVFQWEDSEEKARQEAEKRTDAEITNEMAKKKKHHEQDVRDRLEGADRIIREKLREAANEAHKSALRKKADRMGRIMSNKDETLENGDKRLTLEIEI